MKIIPTYLTLLYAPVPKCNKGRKARCKGQAPLILLLLFSLPPPPPPPPGPATFISSRLKKFKFYQYLNTDYVHGYINKYKIYTFEISQVNSNTQCINHYQNLYTSNTFNHHSNDIAKAGNRLLINQLQISFKTFTTRMVYSVH